MTLEKKKQTSLPCSFENQYLKIVARNDNRFYAKFKCTRGKKHISISRIFSRKRNKVSFLIHIIFKYDFSKLYSEVVYLF